MFETLLRHKLPCSNYEAVLAHYDSRLLTKRKDRKPSLKQQ